MARRGFDVAGGRRVFGFGRLDNGRSDVFLQNYRLGHGGLGHGGTAVHGARIVVLASKGDATWSRWGAIGVPHRHEAGRLRTAERDTDHLPPRRPLVGHRAVYIAWLSAGFLAWDTAWARACFTYWTSLPKAGASVQ